MKVYELKPGDRVQMAGDEATYVGKIESHPLFRGVALVIWRMPEGHPVGEWSHDALSVTQDVGEVVSTPDQREQNLRRALLDRSQW